MSGTATLGAGNVRIGPWELAPGIERRSFRGLLAAAPHGAPAAPTERPAG
jgi:hypothetical protein